MNESKQENIFELELPSAADFPDLSNSFISVEEKTQTSGEKYIVFLLDEIQYAIPADSVTEVIRRLEITSLFNVPEWFMGIANLRGDIVSVIDLQKLWQKDSTPYTPKSKLIVMRCPETDSLIAFKVDKLREIVTLLNEAIQPPEDKDSLFLTGQAKLQSGTVNLLNVENVLCSLRFK